MDRCGGGVQRGEHSKAALARALARPPHRNARACRCPARRRLQPSCGNAAALSRLSMQVDGGGSYSRYQV